VGLAGFSDNISMKTHPLMLAGILFFAAFAGITEASQTGRVELWRGTWITLPEGAEVQRRPSPTARVKKYVFIKAPSFVGAAGEGVSVELIWQKSGLPYGAAFERRWLRDIGYRNVTVRGRGNSYWASYSDNDQGWWAFNRKIRLSPRSMVEASFIVPIELRYAEETQRMRDMIMSISVRRK